MSTQKLGYDPNSRIFTFLSGRNVKIRHVSHYIVAELRKQTPRPQPPKQVVELPGGITEEIDNTAHPAYIQKCEEYQNELNERWRRLLLVRGVDMNVDVDAVKALRSDMKDLDITLPEDDAYVYLFFICITSPDEEQKLIAAIHGYSNPTEESIANAVESF